MWKEVILISLVAVAANVVLLGAHIGVLTSMY